MSNNNVNNSPESQDLFDKNSPNDTIEILKNTSDNFQGLIEDYAETNAETNAEKFEENIEYIFDENDEFDSNINDDFINNQGEIIDKSTHQNSTKWTAEQQQVLDISNHDKNMLVSASAGSGKTAVMTQRIVNLVYKLKIPISNFLVVTFTNASAQEMKLRIIKKLKELPQDDFILEQIDSVSTSDISDLHSFYSRLISTYFYEVEIDPSYHIIDEVESYYLKTKAVNNLFERKEKGNDEQYYKIFDCFQQKRNDNKLKQIIFKFKEYLDSHIDGEQWFFETLDKSYSNNLSDNICAKFIVDFVSDMAGDFAKQADDFANKSLEFGADKLYDYFTNIASNLRVFSKDKTYLANAENALDFSLARFPIIKEEHKFLSDEAHLIHKQIKTGTARFKEYFISSNESELVSSIENSKQLLVSLYNLVKEYSVIYSGLKRDINGLDFNDLEKFAYKILLNQSICKALLSKYKYIFVDEYQDVNGLQEKIISMISAENNRFMVGDLKQSIYGFRLCDPEIFLEKYSQYNIDEKSLVVKLNKNFRSDKKILKFVDKIFSGRMTEKFGGIDYAKESIFSAGDDNLDLANSVNLCYIDTSNDTKKPIISGEVYSVKNHINEDDEETVAICAEAKYVANKISEIKADALAKGKKVLNSDFAVLVFTRGVKILEFIETLKSLGVPVSSDEKNNLMEKSYIQEIVNFVKFVINSRDDYLLFKVLKSRLFNFSDDEIIKIRKLTNKLSFFETIKLFEFLEDETLKQKITDFNNQIIKYKNIALMMNIKDFVKLIVDDFKLENINLLRADGETLNEHTQKFISALPSVSVTEFLINYDQFELEVQNECGGDTVQIMTVHKSKGIEFKYVFVINTSKEINYESASGKVLFNKNFGVGIKEFNTELRVEKPTIPLSAIMLYEKRKIAEEQQRLLYVALTRAKEKLFVICSAKEKELTMDFPTIPSKYIDWFKPIIYEKLNGESYDFEMNFEHYKLDEFLGKGIIKPKQMLFEDIETEKLEEFSYKHTSSVNIQLKNSISKILKLKNQNDNKDNIYEAKKQETNTKLSDNDSFDIDDVYELQEIKLSDDRINLKNNYYAERGTAYHKVFESVDFSNLENIDAQLNEIFQKQAELQSEFNSLVNIDVVKEVLKQPIFSELKNYKVFKEREFFATSSSSIIDENSNDNIMMQGVIDLFAIGEKDLIVLDYKTGKFSQDKFNDYKFQLDFYSSICERYFPDKKIRKMICFIDENRVINL